MEHRRRGGPNGYTFLGWMVTVDAEPLRRSAAMACAAALAELDDARAGWHKFEREDKPAFARWRAREFGALLSKARDVELRLRDAQALVHEVEMEMRRGFQDAHSAYQRVMFRRDHPSAAEEKESSTERSKAGAARALSDFEKEALFQEWVQKSLGTNPDKMDDEAYTTTFEAFKSHMFRAPVDEQPRPGPIRSSPRARREAAGDGSADEEQPAEKTDARVKELYRRLVRRLHPDLRANGSAAVSALWHEVQEAYAASDVPQLEILLALSDIEGNHMSEETSLDRMRSVLAELERASGALGKRLTEAGGEDAWNFARQGAHEELRMSVKRQLLTDLATRTQRLDLLTRTISEWASGPSRNRKVLVGRGG